MLWGLLARTLSRPDNDQPELLATPYWMLRQLGMQCGGTQYLQLRDTLDRLAAVSYHNDAFYNPIEQEFQWVTFSFFSIWLPTRAQSGGVDNQRLWRIEWNPSFYKLAKATGGNLLFDLDLYRSLTPPTRRLYLKLTDRFYRSRTVYLNVADLTVNGMGLSADRPLRKRKHHLERCMRELLEHGIISLGRGHRDVKDLFLKKGKGSYVAVFYEGPYFRQSQVDAGRSRAVVDDELYEPLHDIGFDDAAISHLFVKHSRAVIQRWVRITEVAMKEPPREFPGFKKSAAAFCRDGIQNNRMPPDWMHEHDRRVRDAAWNRDRSLVDKTEQQLRDKYQSDRQAALQAFIGSAGKHLFDDAATQFQTLYRQTHPRTFREEARQAALRKIDAQSLEFPDYSTWVMQQ